MSDKSYYAERNAARRKRDNERKQARRNKANEFRAFATPKVAR